MSRWLLAAGLFAAVWGARLEVIDHFGSDLPKWDQWYAEGAALILPYEQHRLTWHEFVRPHNEHRIGFTRALALGLYVATGRWDARLECVTNAALAAALAVAGFFGGCRAIAGRWHGLWLLLVLFLTALPIAWDNLLSGFHSQQYFLIGFSVAGIVCVGTAARTRVWWVGVICLGCALFAMASGLLAAVAGAAALGWTMRSIREVRAHAPTLMICAGVIAIGCVLQSGAPSAEGLHAHSPGEFVLALLRYAQWPFMRIFPEPWSMLVLPWQWAPWMWLGWRVVRQGVSVDARERTLFALGLWTLLQMAASAYARGAGAPVPASRYVDTLVIGVGVNGLALALLLSARPAGQWRRRALIGGSVLAFIFATVGITLHVTYQFLYRLPLHREHVRTYEASVRAYLVSGDVEELARADVSHLSPRELAEILNHREIRAALPESAQPPGSSNPPLSRVAQAAAQSGDGLFLFGLALIGAAVGLGALRSPSAPTAGHPRTYSGENNFVW